MLECLKSFRGWRLCGQTDSRSGYLCPCLRIPSSGAVASQAGHAWEVHSPGTCSPAPAPPAHTSAGTVQGQLVKSLLGQGMGQQGIQQGVQASPLQRQPIRSVINSVVHCTAAQLQQPLLTAALLMQQALHRSSHDVDQHHGKSGGRPGARGGYRTRECLIAPKTLLSRWAALLGHTPLPCRRQQAYLVDMQREKDSTYSVLPRTHRACCCVAGCCAEGREDSILQVLSPRRPAGACHGQHHNTPDTSCTPTGLNLETQHVEAK